MACLSVTLNRPDSLNSLTAADARRPSDDPASARPPTRGCRVVRLGGAGRGFSSGAGISEDDHANPGASGTPADVLAAANRAVRAIVDTAQAGRRPSCRVRRRASVCRWPLRRHHPGLGQGVLPVGVHQDRADARRRRVGSGGRVDRPHQGDADGAAGRAAARRRRTRRRAWSARCTRPTSSTPPSTGSSRR